MKMMDLALRIDGSLKKQIVEFLEKRDADCSFFDGEPKVWEKIKG